MIEMNPDILVATGGLGLFLLGMLLLTEGLRALTGSTLRRLLRYLEFSETAAAGVTAPYLNLDVI